MSDTVNLPELPPLEKLDTVGASCISTPVLLDDLGCIAPPPPTSPSERSDSPPPPVAECPSSPSTPSSSSSSSSAAPVPAPRAETPPPPPPTVTAPKKRGRKPKSKNKEKNQNQQKKKQGKKRKRDDDDKEENSAKKKKRKGRRKKEKCLTTEGKTAAESTDKPEKKKPGRKHKLDTDDDAPTSKRPVKRERQAITSSLITLPPGSITTPNSVGAPGGSGDEDVSFNTTCLPSIIKPIEAMKKLLNFLTLQFSKEEIVGLSDDSSSQARAELVMNARFFNDYVFKGEKRLDLLLPVDLLCESLKDMKQSHEIDHVFIEANEKRLIMRGRNPNFAEVGKSEIDALPRHEVANRPTELKSTAFYPFIMFLSAHRLHKVLTRLEKTFSIKTVHFWWNSKAETLTISGENTTQRRGKGEHEFKRDNGLSDIKKQYDCGDVKMSFPLSYLAKASHAHTVNDVVRVYLAEDSPIVLQYIIKQSHVSPAEDTDLKFWVFPTHLKTDS